MHVEHQVVARVEPPGEPRRLDVRRAARFPEEEVAGGIERAAHEYEVHAGKSFAGRGLQRARRSRAVHQQVGVVDQSALAGPDLDGAHPSARGQAGGEDDVPIDIRPGRRQGERARRLQHKVWCAELPPVGKSWGPGRIGRRALGSALAYPTGDRGDLLRGEAPVAREIAVPVFRQPRRHVAAVCHGGNQGGALLDILVGEERKRRGVSGMMARRAFPIHQGRDVVRKSDCRRGWRQGQCQRHPETHR